MHIDKSYLPTEIMLKMHTADGPARHGGRSGFRSETSALPDGFQAPHRTVRRVLADGPVLGQKLQRSLVNFKLQIGRSGASGDGRSASFCPNEMYLRTVRH